MRESPITSTLASLAPRLQRFIRASAPWVGGVVSVVLLIAAAFVLRRELAQVRLGDLSAAIEAVPGGALREAFVLTCLSYLALLGYDLAALRQIGARAPLARVALASLASNTFAFTLGFPFLTGVAMRLWIYKRAGVSALQVASVTLVANVIFWLGVSGVLVAGLIFGAGPLAAFDRVPPALNVVFGCIPLGAFVYYSAWARRDRRRLRLFGREIGLPAPRTMFMQLAIGVADIGCAAATLYALLPPESQSIGFFAFGAIYVVAALSGGASNAPGGVGVFEAVMLGALPAPSQEALLAALILFRAIYYLLPFTLAVLLLGTERGFGHLVEIFDSFRRTAVRREAS
ncbi:MAG TPA: lysylphosphatidylglycerol synthase domain-containing protein [Methylocystis sp.]|nr:lysylphosphatidylglycerol synthase domain-containing protein [Methylocystis sp.]